ncbi:ABC transporter permease [Chryseolinea sp. T2]|uniref:ABC transporter permease n=1 Tax=Chryseolinea sp. T2 TaxID=3129255 RepID=UPI003076B038
MIKNYLLTAFRSFFKNRSFTILNVLGLSIGIVASLLILQYVKYERSYDAFHTKANDIYRIQYNQWQNGKLRFECAAAVPAVGPALKNNFPEVRRFTRLFPVSGVISYESPTGIKSFREEKMQITDSSVFEVFDFKLVKGDKSDVLSGPNKAAISERAAKRYFSDEDPIGKTISWDGDRKFEVHGVFADVPDNSHIKFDFMLSYQTLNNESHRQSETNWGWYDFNTYVLLEPGTDVKKFQAKWDNWLVANKDEEWKKTNSKKEFILQPLLDIHLGKVLLQESEPAERGDRESVYALSFIALFILIIAWVNYINLATAKSFDRANEVGVRKALGAQKQQLIYQFLAESILINLVAAIIAVVAVWLLWPSFSSLSGRTIPLTYMIDRDFWLLLVGLFVGGAALSGFYPAMVLSSFKPVAVLKGKVISAGHGNIMRKSLVVFQFAASVFLIVGAIVVYRQLAFMKNQKLGIEIDKTLVLKSPGITDSLYMQKVQLFKDELSKVPGVQSVSASSNVPGDEIFWSSGIRRLTGGPDAPIAGYTVGIDHDYVKSFGLNIVAGRNFDRDHPDERHRVILNRAMAEALDFDDPLDAIGHKVSHGGDTSEIVGILENYHQMSLKEAVVPLVFRFSGGYGNFIAIKIDRENYRDVLTAVETPWNTIFPNNPLDYFVLDQFFNKQYESDRQFGQIFTLFTLLAIFIACLGLFGLSSYMTTQRTKEIGIRKVLGSSVGQVVFLLSKGFLNLVAIAVLIASPIAWIAMERWLTGFPYHVDMSVAVVIIAALLVMIIAFFSVGLQTLRAARVNPAQTLKYE